MNLTKTPGNSSESNDCMLCLDSPIYLPARGSYFLLSLPINAWVLWLMTSSPVFLTDKMEVFEFQLVLTEIVYLCTEPIYLATWGKPTSRWSLNMALLNNMVFYGRLEFQTMMALERCLAVLRPVVFLRYRGLRYRAACCAGIWLHMLFFYGFQLLLCQEPAVFAILCSVSFAFLFVLNSWCCVSILLVLWCRGRRGEGGDPVKRRACQVILVIQVTTVVGYVPSFLLYSLSTTLTEDRFCVWQPITRCLLLCSGLIHPIHSLLRTWRGLHLNTCIFRGS
ncbi:unnamed protein product [Merluccius merluccius]